MIKILTDTSANLERKTIDEYSLTVIPFNYTVNGEVCEKDGTEFDGKAFYDSIRAGADVRTSMINPEGYKDAFEKHLACGDDVIYIGMSGGISGSANAAKFAADELAELYPDRKIAAIDSRAASLGEGLQVIYAAKLLKEGKNFEEIVRMTLEYSDKICQYFTVDDLCHLQKGGRLSKVAAVVGSLLQIKPILTGDENGRIVSCGKARGKKRVLCELADRYAELADDKSAPIGIADADDPSGTEFLIGKLIEKGFCGEAIKVCYEPVTGSHVGPGAIALFFHGTHK